jgi:hypothetical protein
MMKFRWLSKWAPCCSSPFLYHLPSGEAVADTSRAHLGVCQGLPSVSLDILLCSADGESSSPLLPVLSHQESRRSVARGNGCCSPGRKLVHGPFGSILARARSFSIAAMLRLGVLRTSPLVYLPGTCSALHRRDRLVILLCMTIADWLR